jgi:5-amino-6-(5-phosphoribosylamino)uracil reductase
MQQVNHRAAGPEQGLLAPDSRVPSVPRRPYTLLSCAVSVDGCLDDASADRLILSGPDDLDEVDELRAAADAILVGAGTIRADDPRLLIRSPQRVARRQARGLPPHPLRVTVTATGDLDPAARFFAGPGTSLVYCAAPAIAAARDRLGRAAVVIGAGDIPSLRDVLADLHSDRKVVTLLVEGGARVLRDTLRDGLADELRLAVAPFFVGDPAAPRFGLPAAYPRTAAHPVTLAAARRLGDVAVLHYLFGARERPPGLPPPGGSGLPVDRRPARRELDGRLARGRVHDRAHRERDLDLLGLVTAVQALDELVDDQVLRGDLGRPQDHGEIDAGIPEGVVPDGRLVIRHGAFDRSHHIPAHLAGDPLDML